MKRLVVKHSVGEYPVFVGRRVWPSLLPDLAGKGPKSFLFTNPTVFRLHGEKIKDALRKTGEVHVFSMRDGEAFKSLESLAQAYDFLLERGANRKDLIVALGGGVVGDLAGYAAATYMRGLDFLQIPTTLLAQVDSSIGGKTGVNHPLAKNAIGAFKQPLGSIVDLDFLSTLDERQQLAGYVEVFKHGLIRSRPLYEKLAASDPRQTLKNLSLLEEVVFESCRIKAEVVELDEFETDLRAVLNLGHTLGHMAETLTGYSAYLHGEAVLGGLDFAVWRSMKNAGEAVDYEAVNDHLRKMGTQVELEKISKKDFIDTVAKDKKNLAKGIRFVALEAIGKARVEENVSLEDLWEDFKAYQQTERKLLIAQTDASGSVRLPATKN